MCHIEYVRMIVINIHLCHTKIKLKKIILNDDINAHLLSVVFTFTVSLSQKEL